MTVVDGNKACGQRDCVGRVSFPIEDGRFGEWSGRSMPFAGKLSRWLVWPTIDLPLSVRLRHLLFVRFSRKLFDDYSAPDAITTLQ
jgi:hypothetical protein